MTTHIPKIIMPKYQETQLLTVTSKDHLGTQLSILESELSGTQLLTCDVIFMGRTLKIAT